MNKHKDQEYYSSSRTCICWSHILQLEALDKHESNVQLGDEACGVITRDNIRVPSARRDVRGVIGVLQLLQNIRKRLGCIYQQHHFES